MNEYDYQNQQEQLTQLQLRNLQTQGVMPVNTPMNSLNNPRDVPVYPNQDLGFLQWLFSFRKEAIIPLRNSWRGHEFNFDSMKWEKNEQAVPIMNEKGISWAISLIESYLSPVFIVSDFDERSYNFTMREACKGIWINLTIRYQEFGLTKSDIGRVAEEVESKLRAVLLGAKNNGYREFFSTQNQNIETRNLSPQNPQQKVGIFQKMSGLFKQSNQQGQIVQ